MVSQCCAAGELYTGTPQGHEAKIHGIDCYVAAPPPGTAPQGVIVILPDIFGWTLPNTRLLADSYAKKGCYQVYLPEMQSAMAFPPSLLTSLTALEAPGLLAALTRTFHLARVAAYYAPFAYVNTPAAVRKRLYPFLRALRAHEARDLPLGVAGFCWGGYWCFQLARADATVAHPDAVAEAEAEGQGEGVDAKADSRPLADALFTAHPSLMAVPEDISPACRPISIAAAGIDARFPPEQVETVRAILAQRTAETGTLHEVKVYEGCHHGFAVRGGEGEGESGAQEAERQALEWFEGRFAGARR